MKPHSLNMTTDHPVTPTSPESNCTALLILFQILFPLENVNKLLEEELEPMITWRRDNFSMDDLPNPMESKSKHEEHKDIKKTNDKREIYKSWTSLEEMLHKIRRRAAGGNEMDYEKKLVYLEKANMEKEKEIKFLRQQIDKMEKTVENTCYSIHNLQPPTIPDHVGTEHNMALNDKFGPGSKIVIRGSAPTDKSWMTFNLRNSTTIALQIAILWDPDFKSQLALNTVTDGWDDPQSSTPAPIAKGSDFVVSVQCLQKEFKICVNGVVTTTYAHRLPFSSINRLSIVYAANITSIHYHGAT